MQINIEVLSVTKNKFPKYEQLEVAYKDIGNGKVAGKKLMSFVYPEVFKTLSTASTGDKFDIVMNKEPGNDGKEYWQWQSAEKSSDAPKETSNKITPTNKSTYETSEERANRQILIVRQSSLTNAINFAEANKIKDVQEVKSLAQDFVDFVYQKEPEKIPELTDMEDDIPY